MAAIEDDQTKGESQAELLAFAVVGNVLDIPRVPDEDGVVHRGTKAFSPGTKIHVGEWFWGYAEGGGYAIGQNRVSGRVTKAVVPTFLLHNFRPSAIYSARLFSKLDEREAELFEDKEEAAKLAVTLDGIARRARRELHGGQFAYLDAEE